jgi:hypothetical protein
MPGWARQENQKALGMSQRLLPPRVRRLTELAATQRKNAGGAEGVAGAGVERKLLEHQR